MFYDSMLSALKAGAVMQLVKKLGLMQTYANLCWTCFVFHGLF